MGYGVFVKYTPFTANAVNFDPEVENYPPPAGYGPTPPVWGMAPVSV